MVAVADQPAFLDRRGAGRRRVPTRSPTRTSGQSSIPASSSDNRFDGPGRQPGLDLREQEREGPSPAQTRSRGEARPVPTRAARRSRSFAPSSEGRAEVGAKSSRPCTNSATASCRLDDRGEGRSAARSSQSEPGAGPPSAVQVRSIAWRSDPSRRASRRVRVSSRLRRVISSRARTSLPVVGREPGRCGRSPTSGCRGGRRSGRRRPGPRAQSSSTPKPAEGGGAGTARRGPYSPARRRNPRTAGP